MLSWDWAYRRLWPRVTDTGSCWLWHGFTEPKGYGRVGIGRKLVRVHRASYELLVGPIPPGLTLDHLCRVKNCVNPQHLEAVSSDENMSRAIKARRATNECKWGHALVGHNLIIRPQGDHRCRECNNRRYREYLQRRRQAVTS